MPSLPASINSSPALRAASRTERLLDALPERPLPPPSPPRVQFGESSWAAPSVIRESSSAYYDADEQGGASGPRRGPGGCGGLGRVLLHACLIGAVAVTSGYVNSCAGGTTQTTQIIDDNLPRYLPRSRSLSPRSIKGLLAALPLGTAVLGALVAPKLCDWGGRLATLALASAAFVGVDLITHMSKQLLPLLLSRALAGVCVGLTAVATPLTLAEIAPLQSMGSVASLYSVFLAVGSLVEASASLVDTAVATGTGEDFFLLNKVIVLPPAALVAIVAAWMRLRDTPWSLVHKGRTSRAEQALLRLRPRGYDAEPELVQCSSMMEIATWKGVSRARRPVLSICGLFVVQQLSGLPIILFYLDEILDLSSYDAARFTTNFGVAVRPFLSGLQVLVSLLTVALLLGDKVKRRTMLIASCLLVLLGQALCACILLAQPPPTEPAAAGLQPSCAKPPCPGAIGIPTGWGSVAAIVALCIYVAGFSCGLGVVPYFMMADGLGAAIRSRAFALIMAVNYAVAAVVTTLALSALGSISEAACQPGIDCSSSRKSALSFLLLLMWSATLLSAFAIHRWFEEKASGLRSSLRG